MTPAAWPDTVVGLPLADGEHADALDLNDAIVGDGVVMNETADGGFLINLIVAGQAHALGWFEDAAAAWRALDELDHPAAGGSSDEIAARVADASARARDAHTAQLVS